MHLLRSNAQSNATTAAASAAPAAAVIAPALTREDLRDELEVFLNRLRHEVAEQVRQDFDGRCRNPRGSERQSVASCGNSTGCMVVPRISPNSTRSVLSLVPNSMDTSLWSSASSAGTRRATRRGLKTSIAKTLLEKGENLETNVNRKQTKHPPKRFPTKSDASTLALDTGIEVQSKATVSISRDKTFSTTRRMSSDIAELAKQQTITSHRPGVTEKSTYTLLQPIASLESDLTTVERTTTWRDNTKLIVTSNCFEQTVFVLVILNAASLGYDAQYWCEHRAAHGSAISDIYEKMFLVAFFVELSLRIFAFGTSLFTMDSRWWNVFDIVLVTFQTSEQVLKWLAQWRPMDVHLLRLLRIARIMRVTRLIRAINIFDELRVIASSVVNSASSLFWSLLLLWLLMYAFSLIFLEFILSAGETEHAETLEYWFGSLFRTFFTMFECIVGGVSWDEVVAPLMEDIGPFVGLLFGVYISIAVFAMMNLLTSVFVDKAMRTVRDDKDTETAKRIRNVFVGSDNSKDLTWDDFRDHLESPALKDYFKQINVELTEAEYLFELLDTDNSGSISAEEIVEGCLRLRGNARSLDLALLAKDVYDLTVIVNETKLYVLTILQGLGFSTEPGREGTTDLSP